MTQESKSADYDPKRILFIRIPVKTQLQGMIVISEFKTGLGSIVPCYILVLIQEPAFKIHGIPATEHVGIIISKEIEFILLPVEIETILGFRNEISCFIQPVNAGGGT